MVKTHWHQHKSIPLHCSPEMGYKLCLISAQTWSGQRKLIPRIAMVYMGIACFVTTLPSPPLKSLDLKIFQTRFRALQVRASQSEFQVLLSLHNPPFSSVIIPKQNKSGYALQARVLLFKLKFQLLLLCYEHSKMWLPAHLFYILWKRPAIRNSLSQMRSYHFNMTPHNNLWVR